MTAERTSTRTGTSEDRLDDQRLIQAFARLKPDAFGISCGAVAGVLLFAATAVLLIKGPQMRGGVEVLGPNLGLLSNYLPGYSVSWGGAVIGLAWGFGLGFLAGYVLAGFLNFHHAVYLRVLERAFRRQGLLNG